MLAPYPLKLEFWVRIIYIWWKNTSQGKTFVLQIKAMSTLQFMLHHDGRISHFCRNFECRWKVGMSGWKTTSPTFILQKSCHPKQTFLRCGQGAVQKNNGKIWFMSPLRLCFYNVDRRLARDLRRFCSWEKCGVVGCSYSAYNVIFYYMRGLVPNQ